MRIGAQESVAGGLFNAIIHANEDAADALQIFTKNANMWREPALTREVLDAWKAHMALRPDRPTLSHNSYLINLAATNEELFQKSRAAMLAEVQRCVALGVNYVVFHPGSCGAKQRGESDAQFERRQDDGLTRIANALSFIHDRVGDVSTRILLENAAGSGGCLGCTFDQVGTIIRRTHVGGDRLGVCVDVQHAFASGYDLRTRTGYEAMWAEFDRFIGLSRLRAFHLNDSKKPLGSRVDRHDNIGKGLIGLEAFRLLVNDPRFAQIPAVLETPWDDVRPYGHEIALLRSLVGKRDAVRHTATVPDDPRRASTRASSNRSKRQEKTAVPAESKRVARRSAR